MPTIEGIVFIPAALYFFVFYPHLLFPLLVISTAFQGSSVVSSGSLGIQPYYVIATLFVARFLCCKGRSWGNLLRQHSFVRLWLLFAIVAVATAAVLPFLFHGLPVFGPEQTIDDNFINPTRLHFQFTNVVQSVFLILNVLVVIAAAKEGLRVAAAHKAFKWFAYIVVSVVLLQVLFFRFGLPFPQKLLVNNPGYGLVQLNAGQVRPAGTFTEPSMAGAAVAAILAAFLWKYFEGKGGIARCLLPAAACLLVASSSSLLAACIAIVILVLTHPIVRLPWFIKITTLKRLSVFFVLLLGLAFLMFIPSLRAILLAQTLEKSASSSALVRFGADAFSLQIALQTYGLGVGLGSNRPSSFFASLLSQVGVVGLVLFIAACVCTLRGLPKEHRWIGIAGLTLLLAMGFGEPDLSFPALWIMFALAAQSKASERQHVLMAPRQLPVANSMSPLPSGPS
jgi:hypothetical protein